MEPPQTNKLSAPDASRCQIWLMEQTALDGFDRSQLLAICDDGERERFGRFQVERARQQFLAARGLLRGVLAALLQTEPQSLAFAMAEGGKPELRGQPSLHFNLSHSGGVVALAVAERSVGLDIEYAQRERRVDKLATRYFSEAEVRQLRALPSYAQQHQRFYELWTLKEAYIKARGEGLALPLSRFGFLDFSESGFVFDGSGLGDLGDWHFWHWHAQIEEDEYGLALGMQGQGESLPEPVIYRVQPDQLGQLLSSGELPYRQLSYPRRRSC